MSRRRLFTGATLAALLALEVGVVGPVEAATGTYSAPLRTAVRALPVAPEDPATYDRTRSFGGTWTDADRDCRSTRQEVLQTEGTRVTFSNRGCTISGGTWTSFYDAKTYSSPTQLQIDHMIPVSEAWDSGARGWSQARRVAFYNDLGVVYALNAMPTRLNQAKSDRGPESWMPPANRCRYIEIWALMKHRWSLKVDSAERAALIRYADGCPNRALSVPRA